MQQADAVIIGGGVHGTSAAYHLAKAGRQVVLIEKESVGSGASAFSGGIIRCHYSNEAMIRLARRAAELWPRLEEELGQPVDYVQNGFIMAVPPEDKENMERIVGLQQRVGVDVELVAPEEIRRWIPEFNTEGLALASYETSGGYADPYATAMAFGRKARELGAQVLSGTAVTGIELDGAKVRAVITDKGVIRTPLVVNCAGPWAARIAAMVGVELPVRPGLLQMAAFDPRYAGWTASSPTWVDLSRMTYCRPDAAGYMLAGGGLAENEAFHNAEPDPDTYMGRPSDLFEAEMYETLAHRCPWAEKMTRVRSWSGVDGNSPDFHLIFGEVPGIKGYLQVAGGSGNSFKLSPATGEALAEFVATGRCSYLDTEAFSITRFAGGRVFRGGYHMHIAG